MDSGDSRVGNLGGSKTGAGRLGQNSDSDPKKGFVSKVHGPGAPESLSLAANSSFRQSSRTKARLLRWHTYQTPSLQPDSPIAILESHGSGCESLLRLSQLREGFWASYITSPILRKRRMIPALPSSTGGYCENPFFNVWESS